MNFLKIMVHRALTGIYTYITWREDALGVIESEVGRDSWAFLPVIKEIHTLPYVGAKWLGGSKA